jgi:hypothetical protein
LTPKTATKEPDNGTVSAAEARQVLADEQRRKVEACKAEMQAVMDKHGCGLRAVPFVTQDGRLAATVEIVPTE